MATIFGNRDKLERAIRWISAELDERDDLDDLPKLLNEVGLRFDLSPKDEIFLRQFYRDNPPDFDAD